MSSILNLTVKLVAFSDQKPDSNPRLKNVDWIRTITGQPINNPKSETETIPPLTSVLFFDGTRPTTIDGTTAFSVAWSTLNSSKYRFSWTGGTNPGLRTGRNLTLAGSSVTFVVNPNATCTVTTTGSFASVQVGDEIFIPSTQTGDSVNVLSILNGGSWLVLAKASSTSITLVRKPGIDFQGISETQTLASNSQFVAFSSSGIQVGDSVNISSGFSASTRKAYNVEAITDTFFEVISTTAIPAETNITPGAAGMVFYTNNKNFIYLESDQTVSVRVNGDTGDFQKVESVDASDSEQPGQYMRRGPTWSLTVANLSTSPANVTIIHAE